MTDLEKKVEKLEKQVKHFFAVCICLAVQVAIYSLIVIWG